MHAYDQSAFLLVKSAANGNGNVLLLMGEMRCAGRGPGEVAELVKTSSTSPLTLGVRETVRDFGGSEGTRRDGGGVMRPE